MITQLSVEGIVKLRDGTVVFNGQFEGPRLTPGQRGVATPPTGRITVEIIGSGGLDRDLIKPNMESVLVRILEGHLHFIKGGTLSFS